MRILADELLPRFAERRAGYDRDDRFFHEEALFAWAFNGFCQQDMAMEVSGGAGMFRANELERLFRDARCGRFHPANTFLVHEIVAKTVLGTTSVNSRGSASL